MTQTTARLNLDDIMLSKSKQSPKGKHCMNLLM